MSGFKLVAIFSGVIAGVCVLLVPLWILGVPGVQNEYARGWNMGLRVIFLYPLSISFIYGSNLVIWILSQKEQLSTSSLIRWQQTSTVVAIAMLILAITRLVRAFEIMLAK